jgi:putative ABC transport system permease protein
VALLPAGAPRAAEIHIDGVVLGFAVVAALGSSLLFGLAPIFHTRVEHLAEALREGGRSIGSHRQRLRRALVVTEVALAVVLLIGCGLMTRSFVRLTEVDLGLRPGGLSTGQIEISDSHYPTDPDNLNYWLRLQDQLRALPGVAGASVMSGLPPARRLNANNMELVGKTRSPDGPEWNCDFRQIVGDDFLETIGGRLVAGRRFNRGDDANGAPVILVNEAFARKFYPGEDPIGKLVQIQPGRPSPPQTIVGIVADIKQQGVEGPIGTEIYVALRQSEKVSGYVPRNMHLVVQSTMAPRALFGSIRAVVSDLDPSIPLYRLRTFDEILWDAVARPRFMTFLLGVFAGLALALAAVGIYGVMSYTVAQRRRELGIRMALGAQVGGLRRLVLADGLLLAAIGVAVGLGAAYVLNTILAQRLSVLLFDVRAVDPGTFAGVGIVVLGVAAIACAIPAVRATRVDPLVALRHE